MEEPLFIYEIFADKAYPEEKIFAVVAFRDKKFCFEQCKKQPIFLIGKLPCVNLFTVGWIIS